MLVETKQAEQALSPRGAIFVPDLTWHSSAQNRRSWPLLSPRGILTQTSIPLQSLRLLGAFRVVKGSVALPILYVHTVMNGWEIDAMVDIGATHNFVNDVVVAQLELSVSRHTSRVKVINSKVH